MDIRNIRRTIADDNYQTHVHFCYKNDDDSYVSFSPRIMDPVKDEINNIVLNTLDNIQDIQQVEYNQVGALDNTVEISSTVTYPIIQNLINSFDIPSIGNIQPSDIYFFVYEFSNNDDSIYFIRRHQRLKSIRRGFLGEVLQDRFSKIENTNFFGIDDKIDMIIKNEEVLIINHTSFGRIFNLDIAFRNAAEAVLENPDFGQKIKNFNTLKEDLLNNMNYVKRLSKLSEDSALLFLTHNERSQEVIQSFNLDIELDEENNYIYRDKTQLANFINLMQDAYYLTLIGEQKGTDERR